MNFPWFSKVNLTSKHKFKQNYKKLGLSQARILLFPILSTRSRLQKYCSEELYTALKLEGVLLK